MPKANCSLLHFHRVLVLLLASLALVLSCSAPVQKPTGPGADYQDAKDMFQRNRFDRSLEFTDGLATASPATKYTERAQVLRAVIYTAQVESCKNLVEAYAKGADETKNTHFKAEYERLRHDNLQDGMKAALGLAETAHQLLEGGKVSKQLTLEAPYPSVEGPVEVADLEKVKQGGWIEPDHQDAAAVDSLNEGVDDALAGAVGGDRAKARTALASGSTTIDGLDFTIFLGNQLVVGAALFDRKSGNDPVKLRAVCNEASGAVKTAEGLLKETPNADKEKQVKKLDDQIKTTLKHI
ncbi:MAG: hypothetical protein ABSF46_14080 [Terriglobia bacterium]|jgi:hypothetical protein